MADGGGSCGVEEDGDGIEMIGSVDFSVCLEVIGGDFFEFVEFPGSQIVFRKGFPRFSSSCFHFHEDNFLFFPRHNVYFSELLSLGIFVIHLENFEPLLLQILRRYSFTLLSDGLVFTAKEGKYREGHKESGEMLFFVPCWL